MKTIQNFFKYLLVDAIVSAKTINFYGFDGQSIVEQISDATSVDDFIDLMVYHLYYDELKYGITEYNGSDTPSRMKDNLKYSIMNFYYSYVCRMGEKPEHRASDSDKIKDNTRQNVAFSTYVKGNYEEYGYTNENSASARANMLKKEIINGTTALSFYFSDTFEAMGIKSRKGSVPYYDAEVLMQSVFSYPTSPFCIREGYSKEQLVTFMESFKNVLKTEINDKTTDASDNVSEQNDKLKQHVNEYLFESIYNIHFIGVVMGIYNEMTAFLERLKVEESDIEYIGDKCKFFDENVMLQEVRKCLYNNNSLLVYVQEVFKTKIKNFILDLCEFAIIPDVYLREEVLKGFVSQNICNIFGEKGYLDELRKTVAVHTRKAYIYNEIFYYGFMLWIVSKESASGEYVADKLWSKMYDKKFSKMCIDKHITEIEKMLEDDSFDISFENLTERFSDKDNILGEVFQKVLFSISITRIHEKLMCSPLGNISFNKEYNEFVKKALLENVTWENVCDNIMPYEVHRHLKTQNSGLSTDFEARGSI